MGDEKRIETVEELDELLRGRGWEPWHVDVQWVGNLDKARVYAWMYPRTKSTIECNPYAEGFKCKDRTTGRNYIHKGMTEAEVIAQVAEREQRPIDPAG